MTTIGPRQQLLGTLRTEVAALRGRQRPGPAAGKAQAGHDVPPSVALRIQALATDDPDRKRKAVRIFLESTLLRELGGGLVHDPAFPTVVEAIQGQMQGDPRLAAALDQLGDLLLSA